MTYQLSLSVRLKKNFTWVLTTLYIIIILLVMSAQTNLRFILQHILLLIKIAWKYWTASMRGSEVVSAGTHSIKCAVSPGRVTSERLVPEQTGRVTSIDPPAYKGFLNIFVEMQHWIWPASPSRSCSTNCTCSLWLHRLPAVLHSWDPSLWR